MTVTTARQDSFEGAPRTRVEPSGVDLTAIKRSPDPGGGRGLRADDTGDGRGGEIARYAPGESRLAGRRTS